MKSAVLTDKAPQPVGPYSQAIIVERTVYCSGQLAIDPRTKKLMAGSVGDETRQCLNNLKEVLEAAGSSLSSVVKTTVFVSDVRDMKEMNDVYNTFFKAPYPARSTVCKVDLALGARVEIEAIAMLD